MENTATSGKKSVVKQVLILASAVAVGLAVYNAGAWAVKKYMPFV
jgi:hypothetical protein